MKCLQKMLRLLDFQVSFMPQQANPGTQDGAAVYSPLVLKIYDLWVLGFSNRLAWQCSTRSVFLPFFQRHLSANHLDVGVGTGYYLRRSEFSARQQSTWRSQAPSATLIY